MSTGPIWRKAVAFDTLASDLTERILDPQNELFHGLEAVVPMLHQAAPDEHGERRGTVW